MKKFLSMVMAAAMVVSLVPATAFAADGVDMKGTASIGFITIGKPKRNGSLMLKIPGTNSNLPIDFN